MVLAAAKAATTLRDFFEVDHRYVVLATLTALAEEGKIKPDVVQKALKDLGINPDKLNPLTDIVWPGLQK